jgi:hypothetical protein
MIKENALVLLLAALCFVFLCTSAFLPPRMRKLQILLATLAVTSLAVLFDWIAFGPGERQFTMATGVGRMSATSTASDWVGRAFFAFFAVLFDVAALGLWIRLMRERSALQKEQQ